MAKAAVASADEGNFAKGWSQRIKSFYIDVRTEMKKVTTPSVKEVQATTGVVLVTVAIFGIYFFVVDNVIGRGLDFLFRYFSHR